MKGKWALGIPPRHFTWVLKHKIAICERPGGYASNHRRVRRQEEIIWIRENRFDCVISLITSPHNLHNYDELGVQWRQRPFNGADGGPDAVDAGAHPVLLDVREPEEVVCARLAGSGLLLSRPPGCCSQEMTPHMSFPHCSILMRAMPLATSHSPTGDGGAAKAAVAARAKAAAEAATKVKNRVGDTAIPCFAE